MGMETLLLLNVTMLVANLTVMLVTTSHSLKVMKDK